MSDTATRVLLVDDHRELGRSFARLLVAEGYEVTAVYHPREALEHLASASWDLVLTDLYMPEVTGVEVARAALELQPSPAVVIMTATPEQDLVKPARELIGRLPMNKDILPAELFATLERALAERDR